MIGEWITFYNTPSHGLQANHCRAMDRPHTALDKRTPDEAYFAGMKMMKAA
ncbi:MAG: transposase [Alphaproteobacteria bacterium]|nr:transposase [Alphaproteobacteria bacterium]